MSWGERPTVPKGARGPAGAVGHWTTQTAKGIGRVPWLGQWPRWRERLDRRLGGDVRLPGRAGSRRKVPSGNSRYRLYTWTSPFRTRFPSITNLVPMGKRLGRRSAQYAMAPSCNVATLPSQCVELVTGCLIDAVIHAIPRFGSAALLRLYRCQTGTVPGQPSRRPRSCLTETLPADPVVIY